MNKTEYRSNFQVITLCIGFLGIQLGFALQAGNLTRILQNYGAGLSQISLFWIIAPLSGMIIQPIIGYISDKWMIEGKTRIPFLLTGAILSTMALFILPNAELFITLISPLLFGALFMLITDIAFNISMHPLRATITDYLPPSQQSKGFTIQTFLISIGAIIGSSLPYILHNWFNFKSISYSNQIANNVKWSFYIGGIILLISVLINIKGIQSVKSKTIIDKNYTETKLSFKMIPLIIWKIGAIQFFSWSAFFLVWVYMIPAILNHFYAEYIIYPYSKTYEEAADYTGVLFAIYHFSAGICALILPFVYKRINLIKTHSLALLLGGIGLLSIYFSKDMHYLYISMLLLGIAWASILATPFILLSKYVPKNTIGIYFGLFNLFITVPQIVVGLCSGVVIEGIFDNQAIYAIVIAAISLIIAALLCLYYRKDFKT